MRWLWNKIASWGSLTTIEVYTNNNGNNVKRILGDSGSSASSKSGEPSYITDKGNSWSFQKIPYVTGVITSFEMNVLMRQGRLYEAQYIRLTGVQSVLFKAAGLRRTHSGLRGNGSVFGNGVCRILWMQKQEKAIGTQAIAGCRSDGKASLCCFDMDYPLPESGEAQQEMMETV